MAQVSNDLAKAIKDAEYAARSAAMAADEAQDAAHRAEDLAEKVKLGGLKREPLVALLETVEDYLRGIRDRDELAEAARRAGAWRVVA